MDEIISSYTVLFDSINIAIFGPISSGEEFSDEAFDEFSKAEMFFIPIGGGDSFSPKEAAKFVKQFSPKIVIPIFYSQQSDVEDFSSELGTEIEKMDKLTLKKSDLPEESSIRLINLDII